MIISQIVGSWKRSQMQFIMIHPFINSSEVTLVGLFSTIICIPHFGVKVTQKVFRKLLQAFEGRPQNHNTYRHKQHRNYIFLQFVDKNATKFSALVNTQFIKISPDFSGLWQVTAKRYFEFSMCMVELSHPYLAESEYIINSARNCISPT